MSVTDHTAVLRMVTGHAADGRSVVMAEGQPPEVIRDFGGNPGLIFTEIWRTSGALPPVGNEPDPTTDTTGNAFRLAAGDAGSTFRIIDFPASKRDATSAAGSDPGDFVSPMHRTESVDYGIVLSGEMRLILTDSERVLHPGDIVIQRGTDHAWANRSIRRARMAFILIAGRFVPEIRPFIDEVTP